MENRELSIWDMFWAICLKWRVIIFSMLAFAVLLVGFSYYKSYTAVQAEKQKQEEISVEDIKLTEEEQYYADSYLGFKAVYDKQTVYNTNSELMKLNAEKFYLLSLVYYIDNDYEVEYPKVDGFNNVNALAYAYKAKVSAAGLGELVDCTNEYGNLDKEETATFTISIYGDSPEVCENLSEQVQEVIDSSYAEISAQVGKHRVSVVSETCALSSNVDMLDEQKMCADKLTAYGKLMFDAQAKMTPNAKLYAELCEKQQSDVDEEMAESQTPVLKATVSKKYVLLGVIIGAFLSVCFYALAYILNSKILYEDDFEKLYGIHVIGKAKTENKKKLFGVVDRFLERMRSTNSVWLSDEENFNLLIGALMLQVQKNDLEELVLSGRIYSEKQKKLIERVAEELKGKNVSVVLTDSVLYDSQALIKNEEVKQVVLMECAGYTKYSWVKQELDTHRFAGVEILGTVIIK